MKRFLLFVFILCATGLHAQKIENVKFKVERGRIVINYEITGASASQTFDVSVFYRLDRGPWKKISEDDLQGDFGLNLLAGGADTIYWYPKEELSGEMQIKVSAKVNGEGGQPADTIFTETCCGLNMEFVKVKGGTFQMGSNDGNSDEKPVHTVTVDGFYMGKYEVTVEQFIKFLNDIGCKRNGKYNGQELVDMDDSDCPVGYSGGRFYFKGSGVADKPNCPMVEITWYGANEFAKWLSSKTGKQYRLPTEAEWEYAARGGVEALHAMSQYKYAGSNNIDEVAWYWDNSGGKTHRVGTKLPNELGLYDMSGNVWEWCSDWYNSDYYSQSPRNNPQGPSSGGYRVFRGGGWYFGANYCRVASRSGYAPGVSGHDVGFRVALRP